MCPALKQRKMPLGWATGEIVPPALQQEIAANVETDRGVRTVELLLHHDMPPGDRLKPRGDEALIPRLKARVDDVLGAWIFADLVHHAPTRATAMMWPST